MKRKWIPRFFTVMICLAMTILIFPMTASADMGPKPSVRIVFEGLGDEICYGTLLSKNDSTGPSSAWDGIDSHGRYSENEDYSYADFGYDIWKAFVEYEDEDGFYFLQEAWRINETKELAWTYYPPNEFKILLYFPESEIFAVSDIYEKYAFDSYYTVDMTGVEINSVEYNEELSGARIEAYRSYNYLQEAISLLCRIIITILIEMAIALLFGFREKKQLLLLLGVNAATQILLNALLNIINYHSGEMAFVIFYVLFELIVVVVEAVVFCHYLNKLSQKPKPKWLIIIYAVVANAVSFGAGLLIAQWLPGIF